MRNLIAALFAALLVLTLLCGCEAPLPPEGNPPSTYVFHDERIWAVPEETTGIALEDDAELTEAIIIDQQILPTSEGECNVNAEQVQIYDGEGYFLVIIDGKQHLIER